MVGSAALDASLPAAATTDRLPVRVVNAEGYLDNGPSDLTEAASIMRQAQIITSRSVSTSLSDNRSRPVMRFDNAIVEAGARADVTRVANLPERILGGSRKAWKRDE